MKVVVVTLLIFECEAWRLPRVEYNEFDVLATREAIAASGALEVCGVPGLEKAASFLAQAESVKDCFDTEGASSYTMGDGTIRRTVGASSVGGLPGNFRSACADSMVNELRVLVDLAGRKVLNALSHDEAEILPDYSLRQVGHLGDHLEHVHLYEKTPNQEHSDQDQMTLDVHTDGGLMIAMVAGTPGGLSLELISGDVVDLEYRPGCVLLMAGEGLSAWTNKDTFVVARPAPHAFKLLEETRAWYGKMYLPPADALIHDGMTFAEYRKATTNEIAASSSTLGCMGKQDHEHRILNAASPQLCSTQNGDDGILCWTQCVSIESLDCDEAYCIEYDSGGILDGSKHCPGHSFDNCGPQCLVADDTETNSSTVFSRYDYDNSGFCPGDGTTMFMDGFRSVFEKNRPPCINFWNTKWTLDTRARYAGGVIGAFLTGIAVEALVAIRRKVHISTFDIFTLPLHLCQCILGYLAMFLAMTYSVELFAAVCIGATVGYRLFNYRSGAAISRQDPCCAAAEQSLSLTAPEMAETKDGAACTPMKESHSCCGNMP